jgi:four helix bundle protein
MTRRLISHRCDVCERVRRQAPLDDYSNLRVWQVAMDLVVESYRVTDAFPVAERYGLTAQIRRAAVSVPANIAEGYGRSRRGEYLNHLSIARGSLMELQTLLAIEKRLGYLSEAESAGCIALCASVSRMLTRLRRSLEGTASRA